jgi:hypothetical protein
MTRTARLVLLAACLATTSVWAQGTPSSTTPVMLGQDPFVIEALGLSMYIPDGAATSTTMAGNVSASIYDRDAQPRWQIMISAKSTTNVDLTPEQLVDQAAKDLLNKNAELLLQDSSARKGNTRAMTDVTAATRPGESMAAIIERQPMEGQPPLKFLASNGDELPFARVYVALPQIRGNFPVVRGITAVKVSPSQFVLFELFTTGDVYKDFKQTYETSVASSVFSGVAEAGVQRAEMISAGLHLMKGYDTDALIELAENTPERWERYFRAAKDGKQINDEEVGYRRIKVSYGRRGNGKGQSADIRGIIVEIDARFIEKERLIDNKSWFFMTPDREEENWEVTMAVRSLNESSNAKNKTRPATLREIGARLGEEMTVRVEGDGPANVVRPEIAGDGYISRVEGFLMPQLLVKKQIAGRYGFYGYQSNAGKIQFRRDVLDKNENATWTLTTRLAEGQPEQTSTYKADGTLINMLLQNNTQVEPITGEDLLTLWKKKGLPI